MNGAASAVLTVPACASPLTIAMVDAAAAEIVVHDDVVHIQQRPAGEGRKAFDAIDQAGRAWLALVIQPRDEGQDVRPAAQLGRQARPQALRRQMGTQPALSPTPLHQLGTVELHSEGIAG